MATFVWTCFDGGGNVPPSIGIARELELRGHDVVFVGRPEMAPRVAAAGFRAHVLTSSYLHEERYGWHPRGRLFSYLTSPAVGDEILDLCRRLRPDALVVDAMFGAALDVAPAAGVPVCVMLHTFLHRTVDGWDTLMAEQGTARSRSGLGELPGLRTLWGRADALHVNALEEFDTAPTECWPTAGHGGPILEQDARARPLVPRRDTTPLVLVSFSTAAAQSSPGKLQRTLDGLAHLPVRVVATVGSLEPAALRTPANAEVTAFADHGALMSDARLVISHGGHGTAMRALSHGLPLLCLTGRAADQEGVAALDQPRVAAFLEERGAGVSLGADAEPGAIRDATSMLLDDARFHDGAALLAERLRTHDGAVEGADRVVALVGAPRG
ncbi:glycosyltransferase [Oerskovia enterophila]|uniref:glycosyltransferase n=1 Tax=Oerskovia enterophila TaxID=43678 RepID=UPI00339A76BE